MAQWLLTTPIPVIGAALYIAMLVAAATGWFVRMRYAPAETERAYASEGYVVSAVTGLLALLVGFTFALAIDRYETRRALVLDEANAISTVYLRTQLLPPPHRAQLSALIARYTANRQALARQKIEDQGLRDRLERNDALILDLWKATKAALPAIQTQDLTGAYLDSMNTLMDMDAARQHSRRTHVPAEVFLMLVIYQVIAAGVLGFVLGGSRTRTTAALLLLLFGGSLILVIDIDRPDSGGIREDQTSMDQVMALIRDNSPESFDSPAQSIARATGHPPGPASLPPRPDR